MKSESGIQKFLQNASFEAHASEFASSSQEDIQEEIRTLCHTVPQGTTVYIPHAPSEDFSAVTSLSEQFQKAGFHAVPHLCARRLQLAELQSGLQALTKAGITDVLLLGGDVPDEKAGFFKSSSNILNTGLLQAHGIKKVLFGGHPEGNRLNPGRDGADMDILIQKLETAKLLGLESGVVTQISYNPSAVTEWIEDFRSLEWASDILGSTHKRTPLEIGVLGPSSLKDKFDYAAMCSIDSPFKIASKLRIATAVDMVMNSRPDQIIHALAQLNAPDTSLKFATLGHIQSTWSDYIRPLQTGDFSVSRNWTGSHDFDFSAV